MARIELVGIQFGYWTVLAFAGARNRHALWKCQCQCGTIRILRGHTLKRSESRSCGCYRFGRPIERHGSTTRREYNIWAGMVSRCHTLTHKQYPEYGGRGITVCESWRKSFVAFFADMGECPVGMGIDRIQNELGYFRSNCRWATCKQQSRNTRRNRLLTYRSETHCLAEWAEILGLRPGTLYERLARGWSLERICLKEVGISI